MRSLHEKSQFHVNTEKKKGKQRGERKERARETGLKGSVCLYVSKPNKSQTGICNQENKDILRRWSHYWNYR